MLFDDDFDKILKKLFNTDFFDGEDILPYHYSCSVTIGPDGKPIIKEYGNIRPDLKPLDDTRTPLYDKMVNEKEGTLKLVVELPGLEKQEISVTVENNIVIIDAQHGDRNYHVDIPIKQKVDEDSVKAVYTNGILEVQFNIIKQVKPKGKSVKVD